MEFHTRNPISLGNFHFRYATVAAIVVRVTNALKLARSHFSCLLAMAHHPKLPTYLILGQE